MQIVHTLKHFKRHEFTNPDEMDHDLLIKLDQARAHANLPFTITSSYRANDPRYHGSGKAVDIACLGSRMRYIMVPSLLAAGFNRIGVYANHIHVDVGEDPQGVLWHGTYTKGG